MERDRRVAVATLTESAPGAIAMRTRTSAARECRVAEPVALGADQERDRALGVRRHEVVERFAPTGAASARRRRCRRRAGGPGRRATARGAPTAPPARRPSPSAAPCDTADRPSPDRAARRPRRTPARCAGCCRRCRPGRGASTTISGWPGAAAAMIACRVQRWRPLGDRQAAAVEVEAADRVDDVGRGEVDGTDRDGPRGRRRPARAAPARPASLTRIERIV